MKVITKNDLINDAASRYKRQYQRYWNQAASFHPDYTHEECYNRLLKAKTEDDVNRAINVTGWVANRCDQCGEDFEITVQVGQEPDYESRTANICESCLELALTSAQQAHVRDAESSFR